MTLALILNGGRFSLRRREIILFVLVCIQRVGCRSTGGGVKGDCRERGGI